MACNHYWQNGGNGWRWPPLCWFCWPVGWWFWFSIIMGCKTGWPKGALTRAVAQQMERSAAYGGDNLDLVFCGTASPMGNAGRAQQCMGVLAGDKFFIIDSGARSTAVAVNMALPVERLDGVLLTHFHSDHISSLGELHLASWARGRVGQLPLYGGPGVEWVATGFNMAYGLDYGYRTAHHGEAAMPSAHSGFVAQPFKVPTKGSKSFLMKTG